MKVIMNRECFGQVTDSRFTIRDSRLVARAVSKITNVVVTIPCFLTITLTTGKSKEKTQVEVTALRTAGFEGRVRYTATYTRDFLKR